MTDDRSKIANWIVLVVDDEPDSLAVVTRVLRFYGATVFTSSNGRDGFKMVRTVEPTFILSDLSMPEVDGWGLVKLIQEDPHTRHIPVIALTAHAMKGDRERAFEMGFHYYLTKPLNPFTFLQDLLALFSSMENIPAAVAVVLDEIV
jgi:CheY-like chemotaxis protein